MKKMDSGPPPSAPQNEPQSSAHPVPATSWQEVLIRWRWPLTLLLLALLLVGTVFMAYRLSLDRAGRAAGAITDTVSGTAAAVAARVSEVAQGFLTGDVTERFVAAIPEIEGAGVGRLELASARTVETFTRTDERKILWDLVSLGTSVSEIRVPVTYRYHLRLDADWRVEIDNGGAVVFAPALQPSLPAAIHTDGMEKRVDDGWLRFDGEDQLTELERTVTPRLDVYAADPRHLALVRDEARRTVAAFVRGWLLREDQWGSDGVRAIKVLFADEALDPLEIGASIVLRGKPRG
jgi:hypothetical protein